MKIIRWLGAYTNNWNPNESLDLFNKRQKELNRSLVREREVSAEALEKGESSYFSLPVGLLAARGAVKRVWKGDVYSRTLPKSGGKLVARLSYVDCGDRGGAREAFISQQYSHIVIRPDLLTVGGRRVKIIFAIAKKYKLPVLNFYSWTEVKEEDIC